MPRRPLALLALLLAPPTAAVAQVPQPEGVRAPVVRTEVAAGTGTVVELSRRPHDDRRVDGDGRDWQGELPGFGGVLLHSHGELVYEDHYFDAYGADNGQDAQRFAVQDPLAEAAPETYRVDSALTYVPGEFGLPRGPFTWATNYGDLQRVDEADLAELRLATDDDRNLWVLARTTTMKTDESTALLLLLDTVPGETVRTVPYGSGLTTTRGDVAVLLSGERGSWTDLATGETRTFTSVATDSGSYDNAIEARVPAAALGGRAREVAVAAAAGLAGSAGLAELGTGPNVANVAFRVAEPARDWWEKRQALELQKDTMDAFFARADLDRMARGANERYVPGPGYHDRHFVSSQAISAEKARDGIRQHYGVYLPPGYDREQPTPAQYWMHFRGGRAHIAAQVAPGILHDMGETPGSIVITPDGRGTDKWYMGKSHVDFEEVWADSHERFEIDRDRTYVAGHSMGGWASWLLPVLYPDRFAATFPASGLPSYQQSTTPLLANLRGVPAVIFHGTKDELVPVTGAVTQARTLQELGYRYRLYLFPAQEHYGPPIVDQWGEGVRYEHRFVRDRNPAEVTYVRSMAMERAVERTSSDGVPISFSFDRAFWMSGLEPVDEAAGTARFDGRSFAIPRVPHTALPEAGLPTSTDTTGPYTMTGQQWVDDPKGAAPGRNGFRATLTGARAVTLSLARMRLDGYGTLTGSLSTSAPLELTLLGDIDDRARVTIDGAAADFSHKGGRLVVEVPAGDHELRVVPRD